MTSPSLMRVGRARKGKRDRSTRHRCHRRHYLARRASDRLAAVRLYQISPNVDPRTMSRSDVDARMREAIGPIAELVLACLRPDGFDAYVGLSVLDRPGSSDPGSSGEGPPPYPGLERGQMAFGRWRVTPFRSEKDLRAALLNMGDANPRPAPMYAAVRSLISCRSVRHGFDGQAFLALRTEDAPPVSTHPTLFRVDEISDLIATTDLVDGAEGVEDG